MRYVLIFAALLFCIHAWSDAPPKAPRVHTDQEADTSAEIKTSADKQPENPNNSITIIQTSHPGHQSKVSSGEGDESSQQGTEFWSVLGFRFKITDGLLALFTGFLVLVGAWQGRHLRRTVVSYIHGERPYIFPTEPNASGIVNRCNSVLVDGPPLEEPPKAPFVTIAFGNFGKTIAILRELRMELSFGPLPKRPVFVYSQPTLGYHVLRSEKETSAMTFTFSRPLTKPECAAFMSGQLNAHSWGYARYTDIFGKLHEKGMCFRIWIDSHQVQYSISGGGAYNYHRTKKAPKEYQS